jgi:hypothetical protein
VKNLAADEMINLAYTTASLGPLSFSHMLDKGLKLE